MTTQADLRRWFERGLEQGMKQMVVMCDTFDHGDYPIYTQTAQEARDLVANPGSMQRAMEVYDLTKPMEPQVVSLQRAWNYSE